MGAEPIVGVLALQGAFAKHIAMLRFLGVKAIEVRKPEELSICNGLIIPGGESTTIMKQLQFINLFEALNLFAKKNPVFGTCAGLILMSQEIVSDEMRPFQILNVVVERNAFGRQAESFQTEIDISLEMRDKSSFTAVFIRAPRIRSCGKDVKILASYQGEPVFIQQGIHMGTTFHPELTADPAIHNHFLRQIQAS